MAEETDPVAAQILGAMAETTAYNKYVASYTTFKADRADSEGLVLSWLSSMKPKYKASSLWSMFSLVKKHLRVEPHVDLGAAPTIRDFLKCTGAHEAVRHAAAFDRGQIMQCLSTVGAEDGKIGMKLVLGLGYFGGMRVSELVQLTTDCIRKTPLGLKVEDRSSRAGVSVHHPRRRRARGAGHY